MKQLILTKMWRPANSVPQFWSFSIRSSCGFTCKRSWVRIPGQAVIPFVAKHFKIWQKCGDQENKQISWCHFQLYSDGKDFSRHYIETYKPVAISFVDIFRLDSYIECFLEGRERLRLRNSKMLILLYS